MRGNVYLVCCTLPCTFSYLAQGKGDEVQRAQVQLDQISKQLAALEEDRTRVDREVTRLNKAVASHQVGYLCFGDPGFIGTPNKL